MARGELQAVIDDLSKWTYIVGWLAMIALLPLAFTSSNAAIRKLGGKRWKRLHLLTYAVIILSLIHWALKPDGELGPPIVHTVLLTVFVALRLVLDQRRRAVAAEAVPT